MEAITLRPAVESDVPAINDIIAYYALNTVITFAVTPTTEEERLQSFRETIAAGLPYIVAVDETTNQVVGLTSAHGYRGSKAGYRHTVELTLFCRHGYTAKGIGRQLLKKLIEILKAPEDFPEYVSKPRNEDTKVRMVIACMAVDETTWKNGLGLKEFYESNGFKQVGHLKKVGHKFDRW